MTNERWSGRSGLRGERRSCALRAPARHTGRTVACPAGAVACRLTATARPGGASAHARGRPAVAGSAQLRVGAGSRAKIAIRLTPKALKLLRSNHRITLAVSAVLKRGPVRQATTSFAVTVKAPARGRR